MVKKRAGKNFKVGSSRAWFNKRAGNLKVGWGFVPANWKGWVAILIFFGINFFAANYFNLNVLESGRWLRMGVVACLSILVFLLITRKKTQK